jgi:hypothetical protein
MAELTPDVMLLKTDRPNYSDEQIAALNYELTDWLGDLKPGSVVYNETAKAFYREVSRRRRADLT